MVSQKNVQVVEEVSEQLRQHPVIGILDMFKLPASQLHQIRTMLRGKAVIRMVKKRLITLALKEAGLKGAESLGELLQGEPALILSDMNPFKLARMVEQNKSDAPAKEGDIAPADIVVTAGPTSLPPGPVIGELQKAKIPASIEGDKIHIRQDTVVAREGDGIDALLAGVLAKLGITPMKIGLNLISVWEKGTMYGKDILFIPQERYVNDLVAAHQAAFNLSCSACYPTAETLPILLTKAHQEAYNLAMEAGILTSETVKPLLASACARAEALKAKAGISKEEPEKKPDEEPGEKPPEAPEETGKEAQAEKPSDENEAPGKTKEEKPPEKPKDDAQPESTKEKPTKEPENKEKTDEKPQEGR